MHVVQRTLSTMKLRVPLLDDSEEVAVGVKSTARRSHLSSIMSPMGTTRRDPAAWVAPVQNESHDGYREEGVGVQQHTSG